MDTQKIESVSHENRLFPPPERVRRRAWIDSIERYRELYRRSIDDPESFWAEAASDFIWLRKWDKVLSYDWKEKIDIRWFEGAKTNVTINALDRHAEKTPDRIAYHWVGNDPGVVKSITYRELLSDVEKAANVLKKIGVKKGDRVTIYLPMIPELPVSLLACARIGAIHSVVFAGFSAESLKDRLLDAKSSVIITADGGRRGSKTIPLKATIDEAISLCEKEKHTIERCLVVRHTQDAVALREGRDLLWNDELQNVPEHCPPEPMDAEDPLFILYTSGSTGKPKGVLHTTAGYMVYAAHTFRHVFDYHDDDVYFCTADIGWVTGHSYLVYGPLSNGATSVLFEGIPNHPYPDRFWEIVENLKVTIFYTAPTAIRALMREGTLWPEKHDLTSLRILGSVGEPINPEAWIWYQEHIGKGACPIVDTWWQTETGGILISPLPGAVTTKPGSATLPYFGVAPKVLRADGSVADIDEGGSLVITQPWPGMMRSVYGHHERFRKTYFSQFPGVYFTGDGARKDADGYFWLMGRIDDVLNVSGHRLGTAEIESALVAHPSVSEAAVVGYPHEVKGQGIYAFVTLKKDSVLKENSSKYLKDHVRKEIGAIAVPDRLQIVEGLPKTRSGKIMRRILRKIAEGNLEALGDTSTLADPGVVETIVKGRV